MESAQIRNSAGNSVGSHQPNHTAGVNRSATGAGNAWYSTRDITSVEGLLQHNSYLFLAYYAWPRTYPSRSCKRNPWRQHVRRATRRRSQAIDMAWRHVAFTEKKTYPLQTCYEHNMLSLLHAVCLKVLVFFFLHFYRASWYYQSFLFANWCTSELS